MITIVNMEFLFLLPTIAVLFLAALYHRNRRRAERQVEWEKNKDNYKYKDWRY